jgi:predicted ester cyclase
MSEDNKAISRRVFEEMIATRNLDLIEEFTSPEWVNHDPAFPEDVHGIEGAKEIYSGYLAAFPDLKMSVVDQVAEGDKVLTRWVGEGTHEGELMGVAPSGNRVRVEGMTIDRFEGGKIVESWDNWDALGLMHQMGAIPASQPA